MLEDNRRGRAGESSRTVSTAGRSKGLKELTEAKELGRTLVLACFDTRLSWCLSRRLRNRDMPFIVVVDKFDTPCESSRCGLEGFAG
jgi:predicted kinase